MIKHTHKQQASAEAINILLVGNNPIELSSMLDTIRKIPGRNVITEIAFDLTSIGQRLINFRPNFILIDDNIGVRKLTQTVTRLSSNPKTKDIPITVLKNSNYSGSVVSNDIMDYLLKPNLTSEALQKSLVNSLKFKRTRQLVMMAFRKRTNHLLKLIH